jgi:hypothetical protein
LGQVRVSVGLGMRVRVCVGLGMRQVRERQADDERGCHALAGRGEMWGGCERCWVQDACAAPPLR